tara:strand:+ start:18 stop:398 length:381 start_codon:yes stop_codon:yes gene_type:complete
VEIDLRLIFQIVSIAVAIAGALAVAKQQLKTVIEAQMKDQRRLSNIANAVDKLETGSAAFEAVVESKMKIISKILSVDNLEKRNRELENMQVRLDGLRRDVDRQKTEYQSAHNGRHPPIPKYEDMG